jgi:catechol-2,3-dioxygenase
MNEPKTQLSHIEINVRDCARSIRFYDLILKPLDWERFICTRSHTVYCDGTRKPILSPIEERFKEAGFHRKHIGLNHLAFCAKSKEEVGSFYADI